MSKKLYLLKFYKIDKNTFKNVESRFKNQESKNQESCIITGGKPNQCFHLKREEVC